MMKVVKNETEEQKMKARTLAKGGMLLVGLLVVLLCVSVHAETTNFTKAYSEGGVSIKGEESVTSISLNVAIPNIGILEVGEDGNTYHKISIPDSKFLTKEEGAPQLPYLSECIQVPDQATNISINTSINTPVKTYDDILVYPVPKQVTKTTEEGYQYLDEEFYFDAAKYQNTNLIPHAIAEITEDGYFRSVRMIKLNIYPARYLAAPKVLEFTGNITITISWTIDAAIPIKKDTTKGFEKMLSEMILNYEAHKELKELESAPAVLKMTCVQEAASATTQSPVTYITGTELRNTTINCDYLIITHQDFFSSTELDSFANYRANYNNFNIVIAKVNDIYTQFPNADGNDYSIKDFVQYAYGNWQTPPQYLLLLGDTEYVPTHSDDYADYDRWYTLVAGDDNWQDLAEGRLPIRNCGEMQNIAIKIKSYEASAKNEIDYPRQALYVEGCFAHDPNVINAFLNADFDVTELYDHHPLEYIRDDFITAVNEGQSFIYWNGHGAVDSWEIGFIRTDVDLLNNSVYPIIFTLSCSTADLTSAEPSIGEKFVTAEKGAVAYYGATYLSMDNPIPEYAYYEIFDYFEYSLGMSFLSTRMRSGMHFVDEIYVLIGDPALQVFGHNQNENLPDLAISSLGMRYEETGRLHATVNNVGGSNASNVDVTVSRIDDVTNERFPLGNVTIPLVAANSEAEVIVEVIQPPMGEFRVIAHIDPNDCITESIELNNRNGNRIAPVPTFEDITDQIGVIIPSSSNNATFASKADIDNNGFEDFYYSGKLYLNNSDGTFSDITEEAGIPSDVPANATATFCDINNDGYADLFLNAFQSAKWFINNGDGTFTSGSHGSGTLRQIGYGDIDNDGDLDHCSLYQGGSIRIFINNGNQRYDDITSTCGISGIRVNEYHAPLFMDINNDNYLDLIVYREDQDGRDELVIYENNGECFFVQATDINRGVLSEYPSRFAIADSDLDGDFDLYCFGHTKNSHLWHIRYWNNAGDGTLEVQYPPNISTKTNTGYSRPNPQFVELDNMPGEDLVWGIYYIRNSGRGDFQNYEDTSLGKEYYGMYGDSTKSTVLPIDIEGDGDIDLIRVNWQRDEGTTGGSYYMQVLRNRINNDNWIKVKPVGFMTNRSAIGAKVYVYSSNSELVGFNEVSLQRPSPLHFGVDANDRYTVVVYWPASGITDILQDILPSQLITVNEGCTVEAPAAPSGLQATAAVSNEIELSAKVDLSWIDNSDNENGFSIERSQNGIDFMIIGKVVSNTTTFIDTGLDFDTTYYYRVSAFRGMRNSYSNIASVTTPPRPEFQLPEITSIYPPAGTSNSRITIMGNNFGRLTMDSTVCLRSEVLPGFEITHPIPIFHIWTDTRIELDLIDLSSWIFPGDTFTMYDLSVISEGGESNSVPFKYVESGPEIHSISPTVGLSSSLITITGENFGSYVAGASHILVNGMPISRPPESWTDNCIKVYAVSGLEEGEYNISVRAASGAESAAVIFNVFDAMPTISSISPTKGQYDTVVTIYGENFGEWIFGGIADILIDGTPFGLPPNSWTDTQIEVTIGWDCDPGIYNISIRTADGLESNSVTYEIILPITITHFTYSNGAGGEWIVAYGENLAKVNKVTFAGEGGTADAQIWGTSDTYVAFYVAEGLSAGMYKIKVATDACESNELDFEILSPRITSVTTYDGVPITGGAGGEEIMIDGEGFGTTKSLTPTAVVFRGPAGEEEEAQVWYNIREHISSW
jgi:hypothetical protein